MNTRRQILALGFILLFQSYALSQNETNAKSCIRKGHNVEECRIQVKAQDGQLRTYFYDIRRPAPGAPTVLTIPGGPGFGNMGKIPMIAQAFGLPSDVGMIAIDPRGLNKNDYGPDKEGRIYTQNQIVRDIIAVIENEKPQSLIVEGFSHGSVLATVLGHELSKEGSTLPKPAALLIGGVLAKSFDNSADYTKNVNAQLSRILASIPQEQIPTLKARLQKIKNETFKGDDSTMAYWLQFLLVTNIEHGDISYPPNAKAFLQALADPSTSDHDLTALIKTRTRMVQALTEKMQEPFKPGKMSAVIKCQELNMSPSEEVALDINRLQIVITSEGAGSCKDQSFKLKNPFKASDFQVRGVPIVYLQGEYDPATPAAGAKEHYNGQKSTDKIYIEIEQAAHVGPTFFSACPALWKALPKGVLAVKQTFNDCRTKNSSLQSLEIRALQSGNKPSAPTANDSAIPYYGTVPMYGTN